MELGERKIKRICACSFLFAVKDVFKDTKDFLRSVIERDGGRNTSKHVKDGSMSIGFVRESVYDFHRLATIGNQWERCAFTLVHLCAHKNHTLGFATATNDIFTIIRQHFTIFTDSATLDLRFRNFQLMGDCEEVYNRFITNAKIMFNKLLKVRMLENGDPFGTIPWVKEEEIHAVRRISPDQPICFNKGINVMYEKVTQKQFYAFLLGTREKNPHYLVNCCEDVLELILKSLLNII